MKSKLSAVNATIAEAIARTYWPMIRTDGTLLPEAVGCAETIRRSIQIEENPLTAFQEHCGS